MSSLLETLPAPKPRPRLHAFGLWAVELLLRPERFFRVLLRYRSDTTPLLMIWLVGVGSAVDSLHSRIAVNQAFERPLPARLTDWILVWPALLVGGLLGGLLAWFFWGWWYRIRLRLCGAPPDVSRQGARLVWLYSNAVLFVPMAALLLLITPLHRDLLTAVNAAPLTLTELTLPFWSIFVSYRGATSCFPVRPTAARWWFLILPLAVYLFALAFFFVVALAGGTLG